MNKEMNSLSKQPYKGARDFYPEDMKVRNYIFDIWKRIPAKYGFEEYDFPILEPLEIFAAKTGEEIVNEQLFSFEDKGGRKLAIRPELTPGTVRMLAQKFGEITPPVKWFMIGNNWRYERPQLGRGREFYQLEVNIFGVENVQADFEIFSLIIALMEEFGANETMFEIKVSDRRLVNALLKDSLNLDQDTSISVRRLMDKRMKMEKQKFFDELAQLNITMDEMEKIDQFLFSDMESIKETIPEQILESNEGFKSLKQLFLLLKNAELDKYCTFDPSIIRGFDYSDGIVYEVFDKNPNNRRSLFGGERFDKLINIFGDYDLPATGFAVGDWTLPEFLRNWNLIPELENNTEFLVTVWPSEEPSYFEASYQLAQALRNLGKNTSLWLEPSTKIDKQLKYADKKKIQNVIILGEQELSEKTVTVKNLVSGEQETLPYEKFLTDIK